MDNFPEFNGPILQVLLLHPRAHAPTSTAILMAGTPVDSDKIFYSHSGKSIISNRDSNSYLKSFSNPMISMAKPNKKQNNQPSLLLP